MKGQLVDDKTEGRSRISTEFRPNFIMNSSPVMKGQNLGIARVDSSQFWTIPPSMGDLDAVYRYGMNS